MRKVDPVAPAENRAFHAVAEADDPLVGAQAHDRAGAFAFADRHDPPEDCREVRRRREFFDHAFRLLDLFLRRDQSRSPALDLVKQMQHDEPERNRVCPRSLDPVGCFLDIEVGAINVVQCSQGVLRVICRGGSHLFFLLGRWRSPASTTGLG